MARPDSGDLPRWFPRNEGDKLNMSAWVNSQLDAMLDQRVPEESIHEYEAYAGGILSLLDEARERLRKPGLTLAELEKLAEPKRARGRPKVPPLDRLTPVAIASQDVPRIREIWKKHYGRQNKKHFPTAEDIAAERWGVDVEEIRSLRRRDRSRRTDLL